MKVDSGPIINCYARHTTNRNCRMKNVCRNTACTFGAKLRKRYQAILENVTVVIFTATFFLGGSYLFFVQLAEYGW